VRHAIGQRRIDPRRLEAAVGLAGRPVKRSWHRHQTPQAWWRRRWRVPTATELNRILKAAFRRGLEIGIRLPPGVRTLGGVLLASAGFLGFLPVLGFWMVPTGLALIALDVPPLRRWLLARSGVDDSRGR
jgi:hypothetical protein